MWILLSQLALAAPLSGSPLASCDALARATEGDALTLAEGICAFEDGELETAIGTLDRVTDADLRPYARLYSAQAHLEAEQPARAFDALADLHLGGRAGLEVRVLRGQALVQLHRSLDAREDLRELLGTEVSAQARFWLAVGGEDRQERDAAIATYRAVWTRSVRGDWAERSAAALERLGAPVPDTSSAEGRALIEARAKALDDDHQPEAARDLLELLDREEAASTDVGIALARARLTTRDYNGAIEAFASVLGSVDEAEGSARDLFDYALTYARTGDYDTAHELYEEVMAQHPGTEQADFASFKRGYMAYDERDCEAATPLLLEHVSNLPRSEHSASALWFASRCAFLEDKLPEARSLLIRLITEYPDSSLVVGARYWRARATGLLGDEAGEREGLEDVLRRYPVSGYAWFAAERLGRHFAPRVQPARPAFSTAVAQTDPVRIGLKLLDAGLDDFAAEHLSAIGEGSDKQTRLAVAHALLDAGRIREARSLASPWCRSPWQEQDPAAVGVCLPRPERRVVDQVATATGLDAHLAYAIMTAESALNPSVSSWAGARGLMQVMPAEGPRMHQQAFGPGGFFDADRLYDPTYNAALGASELASRAASLGDALDGPDAPAVIASYNGGEEAVRRWVDAHDTAQPSDAWSEEIGYSETRKYVRRVLGFWMAYRWAYGDPE